MAAMARLNRIYRSDTISFGNKLQVVHVSCHFRPPLWLWNMGPACWLCKTKQKQTKKDTDFRNQVPEETSPHLLLGAQDWRLGAEQDLLHCGSSRRTSSGNSQDKETCTVPACHTPRQPLQNHPSGHLEGWETPRSTEEMLDGQHQRVDIPTHTRTAHNDLLQKRLGENLCWIVPHVPPTTESVKGLNWTEERMKEKWVFDCCNKRGLFPGIMTFAFF